jgi:uncharacterized protein YukE
MNFIQEAVSRAREDKDFGTMYLAMAVGELQKQITPPQRTWVGLTEDEINQAYADSYKGFPLHESIEAKLKEKNT